MEQLAGVEISKFNYDYITLKKYYIVELRQYHNRGFFAKLGGIYLYVQLRERYAKEQKKKRQTNDGADIVTKEWEYFLLMGFLKEFIKHRK